MYIRTDNEGNVKELVVIGGMPETNGYEIDSIDEDIANDILSYKYINGEFIKNEDSDILQDNIEIIRKMKIDILSSICHDNIEKGITVNGSHYSLTSNDQIEMIKLESMIKMNPETPVFYHADGEKCRMYTAEEFLTISTAALGWITYNRTYFNLLKSEILEMTDVHDIIDINYGTPLNETNTSTLNLIMGGSESLYDFPVINDTTDYESIINPPNDFNFKEMMTILTNNTEQQPVDEALNTPETEVVNNEEIQTDNIE